MTEQLAFLPISCWSLKNYNGHYQKPPSAQTTLFKSHNSPARQTLLRLVICLLFASGRNLAPVNWEKTRIYFSLYLRSGAMELAMDTHDLGCKGCGPGPFHILSLSLFSTRASQSFRQTDFIHMLADMDSQCLLYIHLCLSWGLGLLCQSSWNEPRGSPGWST